MVSIRLIAIEKVFTFFISVNRASNTFSSCAFRTPYKEPCHLFHISLPKLSLRPISTHQLRTLPYFHLKPIYLVVFKGSYWLSSGISYLEGGFTLRCLQRLSLPDLATLPCTWPSGVGLNRIVQLISEENMPIWLNWQSSWFVISRLRVRVPLVRQMLSQLS